MARPKQQTKLAAAEVRERLRSVRISWLRERRILEAQHGDRWHSILNTRRLERIEQKGRALSRQLRRHPDWWTLPCECKACDEE